MNPRTTLVLAIVAAVLGGLVYYYEIHGAPSREEAAEAERLVFPGTEPTDVQWIEIGCSNRPGPGGGALVELPHAHLSREGQAT